MRTSLVLALVACAGPARRETPAQQPRAVPPDASVASVSTAPSLPIDAAVDAPAVASPAIADAGIARIDPLPEDPEQWPMLAAMGNARAADALAKLPPNQRPCEGTGSMSCDLSSNVSPGAGGKKTMLSGQVSKGFVSGVPGHEGHAMNVAACKVVAIDAKTHKTHTAQVNAKGQYSLGVPAGSYQVVFDDCFECVVKYHPKLEVLTLKAGDWGTASAQCRVLGK
ncbi:MAG TPA: carboxypeptidase-like regulatory domain-containing protein [Kofleriaceae bacterium]|nr:carboxypeptidase-like regulatory domain-containing protein [Kofleriaceae bacterium]